MRPPAATGSLHTPVGPLALAVAGGRLTGVRFGADGPDARAQPALADAVEQLDAYFAGTLTTFDLPLAPAGTPFQRRVWRALEAIPYGETISYRELARQVGDAAACRAVGNANGRNPLAIVLPCHRVVGSDGRLTGYGGGLDRKAWLLEHERRA